MGGKSTLLRSTCVAVIMAQLGCYVAAKRAVVEPVDAIFTRIGANCITRNIYAFLVLLGRALGFLDQPKDLQEAVAMLGFNEWWGP